jgi:hypothetical protein
MRKPHLVLNLHLLLRLSRLNRRSLRNKERLDIWHRSAQAWDMGSETPFSALKNCLEKG